MPAALLTALAVGLTDRMSADQWRVFNATGTTHLVAISGLHVTLFALVAFMVARFAWRWLPCSRAGARAVLAVVRSRGRGGLCIAVRVLGAGPAHLADAVVVRARAPRGKASRRRPFLVARNDVGVVPRSAGTALRGLLALVRGGGGHPDGWQRRGRPRVCRRNPGLGPDARCGRRPTAMRDPAGAGATTFRRVRRVVGGRPGDQSRGHSTRLVRAGAAGAGGCARGVPRARRKPFFFGVAARLYEESWPALTWAADREFALWRATPEDWWFPFAMLAALVLLRPLAGAVAMVSRLRGVAARFRTVAHARTGLGAAQRARCGPRHGGARASRIGTFFSSIRAIAGTRAARACVDGCSPRSMRWVVTGSRPRGASRARW